MTTTNVADVRNLATVWAAILACCCGWGGGHAMAQQDQPLIEIVRSGPSGDAVIERALDSRSQGDFQQLPLTEVVAKLATHHKIPIVIDTLALDEEGIRADIPVTANLTGDTLAEGLSKICEQAKIAWTLRDEALVITSPSSAEQDCRVRVYRVGRGVNHAQLIQDITTTVQPAGWDEVGGLYSIAPFYTGVVINHTLKGHREIANRYRKQLALVSGRPTRLRELAQPPALNKLVAVRFQKTPLEEAAKAVAAACKIDVVLDRNALDNDGIAATTPVTLEVSGLTLDAALRHALAPLGLTFIVERNGLKVTSKTAAESNLVPVTYSVARLVPGQQYDPLIEALTRCVAANSWSDVGGAGKVAVGAQAGTLSVLQTQANQLRINQFVADLNGLAGR